MEERAEARRVPEQLTRKEYKDRKLMFIGDCISSFAVLCIMSIIPIVLIRTGVSLFNPDELIASLVVDGTLIAISTVLMFGVIWVYIDEMSVNVRTINQAKAVYLRSVSVYESERMRIRRKNRNTVIVFDIVVVIITIIIIYIFTPL